MAGGAALAPYVADVTYGVFAVGSVALAVIDARTKRLPNRIVFPLYGVGLVGLGLASWLKHDWTAMVSGLISMAVLYVLFYILAMFGPMGYGDVKLVGVLGLYLGWLGIPVAADGLLLGTASGALVSLGIVLVKLVRRAEWRGTQLAFGPYLLFGAWLAILLSRWS
jgi:leader peptidase (prepilin peptidase) / N-methyltransferase